MITSWLSYIRICIYQTRKSTDKLRKLRYINFCTLSFAAFSGFIADEFEHGENSAGGRNGAGRVRSSEEK